MNKTNSSPKDYREGRRLRAWQLKQQGWSQKAIADAMGVTQGAVSQWMKAAQQQGEAGLKRKIASGAPRRIKAEQEQQLVELLQQGASQQGFVGEVWTLPRVAQVIHRTFGIEYSAKQVGRVLKRLGWSRQKPQRRALQRNEEGIEAWRQAWKSGEKKP